MTHFKTASLITLSTILCSGLTREARAQIPVQHTPVLHGDAGDRHHFHAYAGGHLMGLAAVTQSAESRPDRYLSRFGGGLGLFAGLRLNPYVSLEGNWTFGLHDEANAGEAPTGDLESIYLMTVTADIKVHLPTRSPMEPFLQAGGGMILSGAIELNDKEVPRHNKLSVGATYTLGAGLDVSVTRHISVGGRVLYRGMALGEPREDLRQERRFRNLVHCISVDASASLHF